MYESCLRFRPPGFIAAAVAFGFILVLVAMVMPVAASAQLIFDHGNDIWASNDDGSGAHVLVTAASLGMDQGLGDPAVAPSGSTLLFDGVTHANATVDPLSGAAFYGYNSAGSYSLSGGAVSRLSGAPKATSLPLETDEIHPEPAPGGRYVYQYEKCVPQTTYYNLPGKSCGGWLKTATIAQGATAASAFATPCDGDDGIPSTPPADPSPDPAGNSLRVAYVGCESTDQDGTGITTYRDQLIVSGPGHQGQVTVAKAPGESNAAPGDPDLADPSFSPDGARVVLYNAGGSDFDPLTTQFTTTRGGLYIYNDLTGTNPGRLVLRDPLDPAGDATRIRSPRFMGSGTIVFVLNGSVYSIPASCDACTMASATELRAGGPTAAGQSFSVAWTSGTVAPVRRGGHGHGNLRLSIAKIPRQRLRGLIRHGLKVKVRCSRSCRLRLKLKLARRPARRYGIGTKVGHKSTHLPGGKRKTVRVKLTRKARHRLRRAGRLKLKLHASAKGGGAKATATRKVKVR